MKLETIKNMKLNNAIVFEIELKNGQKSLLTTMYNHTDIDFEELVSKTQIALKNSNKTKSVKTTVGSIKTGEFKGVIFYDTLEFTNSTVTF